MFTWQHLYGFVTSSFFQFPLNLLQNLRITFALNEAHENDTFGRNIQAANLPPKSICNDFFTA